MDDCIFCSLSKESPHIILEDVLCYVIPDRFPTEYGHLLVISKEHVENLLAAPDGTVSDMFLVAKEMGQKLMGKLGAKGLVITTNVGKEAYQLVPHLHIHIIPKYDKNITGFVKHKEQEDKEAESLVGRLKY